jgi:hypothetical protein
MTMFTYYVMKSAANYTEGEAELVAMNNAATLNRYLVDWRFLLQTDPGLLQEGWRGVALIRLPPQGGWRLPAAVYG